MLFEQFRRNCGIIHGVVFLVWCLALRIIPKIELERRHAFPIVVARDNVGIVQPSVSLSSAA